MKKKSAAKTTKRAAGSVIADTSALTGDPRNPRRISDAAAAGLSVSLSEFGDLSGLVFNTRTRELVCGHQRLGEIRKRWGELPIDGDVIRSPEGHEFRLRLVDWPIEKQRAANVAANSQRIAGEFTDDLDVLLSEIQSDSPELFDSLLFGELLQAVETVPGVVEDDVPEPPAKPITKSGDLWLLGEHRLLCGDSSKSENVKRVLDGRKAVCVFTDPPYGVSVAAKNRMLDETSGKGGSSKRNTDNIFDDDLSPAELEARLLPTFENVRTIAMADDCAVFLTAPQVGELWMMMMMMMQKAGLKVRHCLVWKKNAPTFSMGRLDYDYQHEPILMTWGKRHKRLMAGKHKTSVWEIDKPRASAEHPTMKPVELYHNAYLNHTEAGDVVFEPYSGSGTAIIAAEQIGRRACAIEIEPKYCDVAVKRWETLTGQRAKRG